MATRETPKKSKQGAARKSAAKSDLSSAVERLEAKIVALQAERDTLNSELKAARVRIGELEAAHKDAVNRIDWVIDSLHNILEEKT
ncbi:MAG: DUF4164 family protein [Alphaproteobacteria bacterium]|nr:DUF4164 family protein [Alphaproteobacteria bacterium]